VFEGGATWLRATVAWLRAGCVVEACGSVVDRQHEGRGGWLRARGQ